MTTLDDLDIRPGQPEPEAPVPPKPRPPLGVFAVVAALLVSAGLAFWLLRKPSAAAPTPTPTAMPTAPPSPTSLPTPLDLPALDGSDALVRQLSGGLSADARFAQWLATPNLVRTLTAAIVNVSEGGSPAVHLGFLAPTGTFLVAQRKGGLVIDPKSYERYDAFAGIVASLEATACTRVYGQLEPLFDRAYRELGYPEGRFRDVLARGMLHLLETPASDGEVAVRPVMREKLVYELADPGLESRSPAQKHLLRMGAANVRRIHAGLRELLEALRADGGAGHAPSAPNRSR